MAYERTRHNVGFRVVDHLGERSRAPGFRTKLGAEIAEANVGEGRGSGQRTLLCKPMEFMNVSGEAVGRVAKFWKVAPTEIVVVHDDLDLPFGRLKLGAGGGHGGHNGLRSMIACLGGPDFARVRFGVGRPPAGHDPADYVLAPFARAEENQLPALIDNAADAVVAVVTQGLTAAMNRFNSKAGPVPAAGGAA